MDVCSDWLLAVTCVPVKHTDQCTSDTARSSTFTDEITYEMDSRVEKDMKFS